MQINSGKWVMASLGFSRLLFCQHCSLNVSLKSSSTHHVWNEQMDRWLCDWQPQALNMAIIQKWPNLVIIIADNLQNEQKKLLMSANLSSVNWTPEWRRLWITRQRKFGLSSWILFNSALYVSDVPSRYSYN